MPEDKKKENRDPVTNKATGDPGSWGQEELQARTDKIEKIGYLPLDVDIDEVQVAEVEGSQDETTPPEAEPSPRGKK